LKRASRKPEEERRKMNADVIEKIIQAHSPKIEREMEISKKEYATRWARVQKAMREKGYDVGYACGSELDRSDVAWLAGVFDPIIERYGILVPARGKPVVIAGSEGGHVIEDCVKVSGANIALLREYQISDEDYRFAKFGTLEKVVSRLVPYRPGKAVKFAIFSSGQFIPYDHVAMLQGRFGADNVVFDLDLLRKIKYKKSLAELKITGIANRIADAAFLGMLAVLKPGVRELDLAAAADYIMKRLGARRSGFPPIVSSGRRGRTVLGPATNRIIKKSEFVSLGISPTFNGYHGIMRRTVKVGAAWTKEEKIFMDALKGLYHTVIKATAEAARKGSPSSFIDQAGKKYLDRTKIRDKSKRLLTPREPYTFIHNTGCSECQEGYGAVTPYSDHPLGKNAALMIDVAFMGFDEKHDLVFPIEYAVIEDSFWKKGKEIGVYNRIPLAVQNFVGKDLTDIPKERENPYYRPL
jgi:Xaa-Pro aminopeptidase